MGSKRKRKKKTQPIHPIVSQMIFFWDSPPPPLAIWMAKAKIAMFWDNNKQFLRKGGSCYFGTGNNIILSQNIGLSTTALLSLIHRSLNRNFFSAFCTQNMCSNNEPWTLANSEKRLKYLFFPAFIVALHPAVHAIHLLLLNLHLKLAVTQRCKTWALFTI